MGEQLSGVRIAGVAVLLFSAVLLGVGMHHLVATGTCSSTGYSANYGPVPHCPSGTGWWFAFLFAGIIGTLVGAMMAGSIGLIFAGMFGAIGVGALTIAFDSQARSSTQVFGAVFGGVFALVGITAAVFVLVGAIKSLRPRQVQYGKTKTSSHGTGQGAPPSAGSLGLPTPTPTAATVPPTFVASSTPLNLVPGLQAVRSMAADNAVEELTKLSELHAQGGLTDAEFASAKEKLLGQL